MDIKQVKELIGQLEASKLKKLIYKDGDVEIHLEKEDCPTARPHHEPAVEQRSYPHSEHASVKGGHREEKSGTFVTSPMVGTFYTSPGPENPSFVKVGSHVTEETIVCIVEAMKVMNEVKAGVSGTVAEVLIENGQPVEFGARLFRIA